MLHRARDAEAGGEAGREGEGGSFWGRDTNPCLGPAFLPGWSDLRAGGVSALACHCGVQRGLPGSEWAAQKGPKPGAAQGSPQAPLCPVSNPHHPEAKPDKPHPPRPPHAALPGEGWPLGGAQRVP